MHARSTVCQMRSKPTFSIQQRSMNKEEFMAKEKEPFIGTGDRPDVSLKPDTPITQLTVRDLSALIGEGIDLLIPRKFRIGESHVKAKSEVIDFMIRKELKDVSDSHIPVSFEGPSPIERLIDQITKLNADVQQLRNDVEILKNRGR